MQHLPVGRSSGSPGSRSSKLIWTALVLFLSLSPTLAAQQSNLEVGTVVAAGNVIWVRATRSGAVEFFMSQGYRDALARPYLVDANRLVQFTDSAKSLKAPATGVADARAASDTGLAFERWVGADSSGLEILHDGSTILRVSETPARELVELLSRGAELARQVSTPARPVASRVAVRSTKRVAEAKVEPMANLAPAPAAAITVRQETVVATPEASVAAAPGSPVLDPELTPSVDANILRSASPSDETDTRRRGVISANVTVAPPPLLMPVDKHVDTPLGPFVVPAAKLVDRDTQIKYCYTELGLRYDRRLTGTVTVRVSLNDAGHPDTVEVTKRTWDGVAAAEVESCMRALIEDWSFDDRQPPDSRTVELHFTLTPAMRTATTDGAPTAAQPR